MSAIVRSTQVVGVHGVVTVVWRHTIRLNNCDATK